MYDRNRSECKSGAISFLSRNSSSQKSEFRSKEIFQLGRHESAKWLFSNCSTNVSRVNNKINISMVWNAVFFQVLFLPLAPRYWLFLPPHCLFSATVSSALSGLGGGEYLLKSLCPVCLVLRSAGSGCPRLSPVLVRLCPRADTARIRCTGLAFPPSMLIGAFLRSSGGSFSSQQHPSYKQLISLLPFFNWSKSSKSFYPFISRCPHISCP